MWAFAIYDSGFSLQNLISKNNRQPTEKDKDAVTGWFCNLRIKKWTSHFVWMALPFCYFSEYRSYQHIYYYLNFPCNQTNGSPSIRINKRTEKVDRDGIWSGSILEKIYAIEPKSNLLMT